MICIDIVPSCFYELGLNQLTGFICSFITAELCKNTIILTVPVGNTFKKPNQVALQIIIGCFFNNSLKCNKLPCITNIQPCQCWLDCPRKLKLNHTIWPQLLYVYLFSSLFITMMYNFGCSRASFFHYHLMYFSKWKSKWVQRAIWMGRLCSRDGSNWHGNPSHPTTPHVIAKFSLQASQAHWNKALRLCCKPWFTRLCLCNAPMNMNIIICWHQDTRQIKTRLSGLLLLFQARVLNKNLKMRELK